MEKLRHQHIYDLAELCFRQGIRNAVICPGSRSAPLALAFGNHPGINCHIRPDERSAGFVALGISQATGTPTVLVCTSGSAALNFAPAVAEAYYQQIPLLVCTADRPPEWINQRDGQTIDQSRIYGNHIKKELQVHANDNEAGHWIANRMMNEAILTSLEFPAGPVHLNFPFREPLYPTPEIAVRFGDPRIIQRSAVKVELTPAEVSSIRKLLTATKKVLLVGGQLPPDSTLRAAVRTFSRSFQAPVITEAVSNLGNVPGAITNADLFIGAMSDQDMAFLQPDLLITWGDGIVSRHIKAFLRKYPARDHLHVQLAGPVADTFMSLTRIIYCTPVDFFRSVNKIPERTDRQVYKDQWKKLEKIVDHSLKFAGSSEPGWVSTLLKAIPGGTNLQLANSLSVRYVNMLFGKRLKAEVKVWCNRGTSGIDGCTSTAVGHHLASGEPCVLITGDVAFFYDRNAFWPKAPGGGFRVVILNNRGGQIFSMIDGPRDRKEARALFIGDQPLDARHLCSEYGMHYIDGRSSRDPEQLIEEFFKPRNNATVLEIFTDPVENRKTVDSLKQTLRSIL